jgi:hypothetical protein
LRLIAAKIILDNWIFSNWPLLRIGLIANMGEIQEKFNYRSFLFEKLS